jgi:sulfonate transport system substrate-binding protein
MTRFIRRWITSAVLSVSIVAATVGASYGQDKVVRIGFQKYGKLVLLKSKGTLEDKLKAAGYKVVWTEFPSGPPLLEALNVGAIDFGNTGEAPPIFAQAAGAPIRYVAYEPPAPKGEAILAPADARAAFERGAVDAWVIWDPFQAAAEAATAAKTLADGTGIVSNYQFYFSSKKFLESDPGIVDLVLEQLGEVDDWAKVDLHAVAEQLAPAIGLSVPVVEVALKRQSYGIKPITEGVIADQQQVADSFFALGLLPKQIRIFDAARRPGT